MKKIQILGTGCAKCNRLGDNAKQAAESSGIEYEIEKVTDLIEISKMGVMSTPALVIDGVLKSSGTLLTPHEISRFLDN